MMSNQKPLILVTTSIDSNDERYNRVSRDYCRSIISSGGIPVITDYALINDIDQLMEVADGLLLTGGGDVHPKRFGEEIHEKTDLIYEDRDEFEMSLFLKAFEKNKPVFGICRGSQLINVALGGSLIQHIDLHLSFEERFSQVHGINIEENSLLLDIIGQPRLGVNSVHHQCLGKVAEGLHVSAYSDDGIIEAIEYRDKKFLIGVQWHPEILYENYEIHRKLFDRFISECMTKV
jgi:putative glutamine amidotransferase